MIIHKKITVLCSPEHHNRQIMTIMLFENHLITLALSGHKMARGSLPAVEAGRLLACGGEHSGHAMLGTATA